MKFIKKSNHIHVSLSYIAIIATALSKHGSVYKNLKAIVSIDEIPKQKLGIHDYIIFNLSPKSEVRGSHWCVS